MRTFDNFHLLGMLAPNPEGFSLDFRAHLAPPQNCGRGGQRSYPDATGGRSADDPPQEIVSAQPVSTLGCRVAVGTCERATVPPGILFSGQLPNRRVLGTGLYFEDRRRVRNHGTPGCSVRAKRTFAVLTRKRMIDQS
jgi:hypothetical protein